MNTFIGDNKNWPHIPVYIMCIVGMLAVHIQLFMFYSSYIEEIKECRKNGQGEIKKSSSKKWYIFMAIVFLFIAVATYQAIFGETVLFYSRITQYCGLSINVLNVSV